MRWVARILGCLVLVVALLAVFLNIGPGRLALEAAVNRFTPAQITGLSGRFPDQLRVARLSVSDAAGPWLVAEDLALDWSPLRLLRRHASVQALSARRIAVGRLPISAPGPATPTTPSPATLPVRVTIDVLRLATLELGAAVLGTPASFAATGRVELPQLTSGDGALTLVRQDQPGQYGLTLSAGDTLATALTIDEPAGGLLGTLAGLSPGAPVAARATLTGPLRAAVLALDGTAGPLTLSAGGTIDLVAEMLDVQVHAGSPAMAMAGAAWDGAALDAAVRGPWASPGGTAQFRMTALRAPGLTLRELAASATAPDPGRVQLSATLTGLHADAAPGLLDAAPVTITADAQLAAPRRPVAFTVAHPLAMLAGDVEADTLAATATLTLPALDRLAALAGIALQGQAALRLAGTPSHLTIDGTTSITAGAPYAALIGPDAMLRLTLDRVGERLAVSRLLLDGKAVRLSGQGTLDGGILDATVEAALTGLGVVAPGWTGALKLDAGAKGPLDAIAVRGMLSGTVGAPGQRPGPLTATIDATGLPGSPAVTIAADGTLAGAPLTLAAELRQAAGVTQVKIGQARWKSVQAAGTLQLAPVATGTGDGRDRIAGRHRRTRRRPAGGWQARGTADAGARDGPAGADAGPAVPPPRFKWRGRSWTRRSRARPTRSWRARWSWMAWSPGPPGAAPGSRRMGRSTPWPCAPRAPGRPAAGRSASAWPAPSMARPASCGWRRPRQRCAATRSGCWPPPRSGWPMASASTGCCWARVRWSWSWPGGLVPR